MVESDLSNLLETNAKVSFQFGNLVNTSNVSAYEEWDIGKAINVDVLGTDAEFNCYTENPDILEAIESDQEQFLYSGLLKSNCRVTSQPDWGDVVVYINGDKVIEPNSFLKYVVSFRDECHFHEEICECIYKRIYDKLKPRELLVMCLYARRGGIDMFDCVLPTRSGRTGLAFTWNGRVNVKNKKYQNDNSPLDKDCDNLELNKYSLNYLNHLFNTNEILASMILTLHNINFYQELMRSIRSNIQKGTFDKFHDKYIDKL